MDDQVTQISELFAAPKGDLQLVINFGGVKIYTSNMHEKKMERCLCAKSTKTNAQ